jgi:hypothetical protein
LASWIAAVPTPLAPAWISTVSPAFRWPNSNKQSSAVPNATGITEASLGLNPGGIGQALRAGTARSSACEPKALEVATFWPTLRLFTSDPTSTISPAAW